MPARYQNFYAPSLEIAWIFSFLLQRTLNQIKTFANAFHLPLNGFPIAKFMTVRLLFISGNQINLIRFRKPMFFKVWCQLNRKLCHSVLHVTRWLWKAHSIAMHSLETQGSLWMMERLCLRPFNSKFIEVHEAMKATTVRFRSTVLRRTEPQNSSPWLPRRGGERRESFLLWLMEPSRFIFTFSLYCVSFKAPRKFNKSEITDKLESLFAIINTLIKLLWQPT